MSMFSVYRFCIHDLPARAGVKARTAAIPALLAGALVALGGVDCAFGEQRSRSASAPLPQVASARSPSSGARFFTINEVLRQRGASLRDRASPMIRTASVEAAKLRETLSDASPLSYPTAPRGGPFGMANFRAPEGLLWVKWRKLEAEMRRDSAIIAQCRSAPDRCPSAEARRVSSIVGAVEARSGRARLDEANRAVNGSIRDLSDLAQHGTPDLWSAALATFSRGKGDCEDYAIAKYTILRAAGVPAEDLRIMLVRDMSARQDHAVLAVLVNGKWLILDNRRSEISEDREIGYLVPLFVLDHQGVSLLARPYATVSPAKMRSAAP